MTEFWLAIGAASAISAAVGAIVASVVRDRRVDGLARDLEARARTADQIQADWDNRLKSRVQRLERADREVRLRLMGQDAQLRRLADGLGDLQATHDTMGEVFLGGADAVTDSPSEDDVIPMPGAASGWRGA